MSDKHDPNAQVKEENPWYIDEQFKKQLGEPGARRVIENRWRIFEKNIRVFDRARSGAENPSSLQILDAGCGDGINLLGLSSIIERNNLNACLYGVDYNPVRVERAKKIKGVWEVREADLKALPFENNFFDIVLCNHVLEHIPDDYSVLKELHRVIKKSGSLMLGVPNEGCFIAQLRNRFLQRSILRTTDHVHFYTKQLILSKLYQSGFKAVDIKQEGFFTPHSWLHYLVTRFGMGSAVLRFLSRVAPSQCADLIVSSGKMV